MSPTGGLRFCDCRGVPGLRGVSRYYGAPVSLDSLVLAFPLLPVLDCMVLVPVLAPDDSSALPERPSRGEKRPCAVSASRDLSR